MRWRFWNRIRTRHGSPAHFRCNLEQRDSYARIMLSFFFTFSRLNFDFEFVAVHSRIRSITNFKWRFCHFVQCCIWGEAVKKCSVDDGFQITNLCRFSYHLLSNSFDSKIRGNVKFVKVISHILSCQYCDKFQSLFDYLWFSKCEYLWEFCKISKYYRISTITKNYKNKQIL